MNRNLQAVLVAAFLVLASAPAALACGTCGCSLNSDWASQGYSIGTGFRMDLRFDYFDQDQLRSGTGVVDRQTLSFPSEQEIQLRTINRNYTLDIAYYFNANWGIDAFVPAAVRTHSTIGEGHMAPSASRSSGLGDIRLVARYQGSLPDGSLGLQFGLKLPTGRTGDRFYSGPLAGEPVDRGLQLGSGTTDTLLGIYKFGTLAPEWGYFVQAMVQFPLDSYREFKPGASITASGGIRYTGLGSFTPQVQLILRAESPESGAESDHPNSGATLAYLSPGFTASLGPRVQVYAFVQVPFYQRVTGYQLEPRYLASAGLHFRF